MTWSRKIALVGLGHISAVVVAVAAVAIRVATTNDPGAQASSGMYAFGDALLFIAVFGLVSLAPTGALLLFLRPYRRFWIALSAVVLVVAVTAIAATSLFAIDRHSAPAAMSGWAILSVLRLLVAPLLALAFFVCALLSPYRAPRFVLLGASALEAAASAYAGLAWFVPLIFDRA